MSIFKSYDIRGVYPEELNEKTAYKIGAAFGTFIPGKKIIVGSDVRLSSPSLKKSLIEGIVSTGKNVIDIEIVATPVIFFAIRNLKSDGGIIVTASHNPKEYNGFKLYDKDSIPISYESGIAQIKEIVEKEEFKNGEKGEVVTKNLLEDYTSFLLNNINIKSDLRVVVDCGNGPTGLIYPYAIKETGAEVHELFTEPDGNFPNHHPDPSQLKNLNHLMDKVKEVGAHVGFAYDGDGDRVVVVDENGEVVDVRIIFSLLIKDLLKKSPESKIIYTILDSLAIEETIKSWGGVPIVCKVGHTYISRKMIKEHASLGGEVSGHYYFKETFGGDDALFATLKIIETLTKSNKKLSEYVKEFFEQFPLITNNIRVPIKESEKISFMENLIKEIKEKSYEIDTLDGVKIFFEEGWSLFRPSNTEPRIVIAYESKTQEGFNKIKSFVEEIIEKIPN